MVNDCLKHSVTIYDSSDNLLEVLCLSNPIFTLECANKGYKFRMLNGAILDTNQYEFKYGVGSDTSGTGNIHYSAKPKQALSIPAPPSSVSCSQKYSCNLGNMGGLQKALSEGNVHSTINLRALNIIKQGVSKEECSYAYDTDVSAYHDFAVSGCATFYKGKDPHWKWNYMSAPGWGWPYKCTPTGCSRETAPISWSKYYYVDARTCKSGLSWYTVKRNGDLQLIQKPCPTPPPPPTPEPPGCKGTLITLEGGAAPGPWPSYPPDDVCWLVGYTPRGGAGCDFKTYYTLSGYQCGMSGDQCVTGGWLPGDKRASCKLPDPIPPTPAPDPSCNSENCCLLPSMSIMGWKGDCSYFTSDEAYCQRATTLSYEKCIFDSKAGKCVKDRQCRKNCYCNDPRWNVPPSPYVADN